MSVKTTDQHDEVWEHGWDGHSRAQHVRLARLPLAERIAWLEEAQVVLTRLREQQDTTRRGGASAPPDGRR